MSKNRGEAMNKKILLQIGIVVVIASFFVQMAAPGLMRNLNLGGSSSTTGEPKVGISLFNGTIRTYDPQLYIVGNVNQTTLDMIKNDTRVIRTAQNAQGWQVDLALRDDVYSLAKDMRNNYNLTTQSIANIIPPSQIPVYLNNGTVLNASTSLYLNGIGPFKIALEPFVDVDNKVTIQMQAQTQENININNRFYPGHNLIGISTPAIIKIKTTLNLNATVLSKNKMINTFAVPWENRTKVNITSIEAKYGKENVSYSKYNRIYLSKSLTVTEIVDLKTKTQYITYLGSDSAEIRKDFTDKNKIVSDFKNMTVVFPHSIIIVTSDSKVKLPYEKTTLHYYTLKLPKQTKGYTIQDTEKQFTSNSSLIVNSTLNLEIEGETIGNIMTKVNSIKKSS